VLEEMVTARAITCEERARMVLGAFPRRKRDLLAPFMHDAHFHLLTIEHIQIFDLHDPPGQTMNRTATRKLSQRNTPGSSAPYSCRRWHQRSTACAPVRPRRCVTSRTAWRLASRSVSRATLARCTLRYKRSSWRSAPDDTPTTTRTLPRTPLLVLSCQQEPRNRQRNNDQAQHQQSIGAFRQPSWAALHRFLRPPGRMAPTVVQHKTRHPTPWRSSRSQGQSEACHSVVELLYLQTNAKAIRRLPGGSAHLSVPPPEGPDPTLALLQRCRSEISSFCGNRDDNFSFSVILAPMRNLLHSLLI
jgi:hypothetical protein